SKKNQSPTKPDQNGDKGNESEGLPDADADKPTRESIVSETSTALDTLDVSCSTQADNLFASYTNATSSEAKMKYLSQGLSLLNSCESQVEGLIESMET